MDPTFAPPTGQDPSFSAGGRLQAAPLVAPLPLTQTSRWAGPRPPASPRESVRPRPASVRFSPSDPSFLGPSRDDLLRRAVVAIDLSSDVPADVRPLLEKETSAYSKFDLDEAVDELRIGWKKRRLPRGVPAARRTWYAAKKAAEALRGHGEHKWAKRLETCSSWFWTVACPNGHGATVVAAKTKRCGLACCPTCTRLQARRLARAVASEMARVPSLGGYRWRFLTVSLKPGATHKESWDQITEIRSRVMGFLRGLCGGVNPSSVAAIEFGEKGHPHLHILYLGPWVVRTTLQQKLTLWTGGEVVQLPREEWVPEGRPTKRGKQRYRKWKAVGGSCMVDIREVKGGLSGGVREVLKYQTDIFRGAGDVRDPAERVKVLGATRLAVAVAVAGKGKHRVQGYGLLKGVVSRCLGKQRKKQEEDAKADGAAGDAPAKSRVPEACCPHCKALMVVVPKVSRETVNWGNRNIAEAYRPPPAPR